MKRLFPVLLILLMPSLLCAEELSVFAASSLTGALKDIAAQYQARNPATRILLHYAGSQSLAAQIEQGAPADLFVSANNAAMNRLAQDGLVEPPRLLARNQLVIATATGLEPPLRQLQELVRPNLLLAIGNPQVPVGAYTRQFFERLAQSSAEGPELVAGIRRNIVSEENKVKAIVAKLLLGEVDAGIVYLSDLHGTPLGSLKLPEALNPQASYPVAIVRGGQQAQARAFLDYLTGAEAREILTRHGLLPAGGLP